MYEAGRNKPYKDKHSLIAKVRQNICRLKKICEDMGVDTPLHIETDHIYGEPSKEQLAKMYRTAREEEYWYRSLRDKEEQNKRRRKYTRVSKVEKDTFKARRYKETSGYHSDDTLFSTNFDDDDDTVCYSPPPTSPLPPIPMWEQEPQHEHFSDPHKPQLKPILPECSRKSVIVSIPRISLPTAQSVNSDDIVIKSDEANHLLQMGLAVYKAAEVSDIKGAVEAARELIECYTGDKTSAGTDDAGEPVNTVAHMSDFATTNEIDQDKQAYGCRPVYDCQAGIDSDILEDALISPDISNQGSTVSMLAPVNGIVSYDEGQVMSIAEGAQVSIQSAVYNGTLGDIMITPEISNTVPTVSVFAPDDTLGDAVISPDISNRGVTVNILAPGMGMVNCDDGQMSSIVQGAQKHDMVIYQDQDSGGTSSCDTEKSYVNPRIVSLPEPLKIYEELEGHVLFKSFPDGTCQFQSHSMATRQTTYTKDYCQTLDGAMMQHKEAFHFTDAWIGFPLILKYGKGEIEPVNNMMQYKKFLRSKRSLTMWRDQVHLCALSSLTNTEIVVYEARADGTRVPRKWYYPNPSQDIFETQNPNERVKVRLLYSGDHYDLLVSSDHPIVNSPTVQTGKPTGPGVNGIMPIDCKYVNDVKFVDDKVDKNDEPKFIQIRNHLEGKRVKKMFLTLLRASKRETSARNKLFHENERHRKCDLYDLDDSLSSKCNLGFFEDQETLKQLMDYLREEVLAPNINLASFDFLNNNPDYMYHYVETVLFPHSMISYLRMRNGYDFDTAERVFETKNKLHLDEDRKALEEEIYENQKKNEIVTEREGMKRKFKYNENLSKKENKKIMREKIRRNEGFDDPDIVEEACRVLEESTDHHSDNSNAETDQQDVFYHHKSDIVAKVSENSFSEDEEQEIPVIDLDVSNEHMEAENNDIEIDASKERAEKEVDQDSDDTSGGSSDGSSSSENSDSSSDSSSCDEEDTKDIEDGTSNEEKRKGESRDPSCDIILKINETEAEETLHGKQLVKDKTGIEPSTETKGKGTLDREMVKETKKQSISDSYYQRDIEKYNKQAPEKVDKDPTENKNHCKREITGYAKNINQDRRAIEERTPSKKMYTYIHYDEEKQRDRAKRPHHFDATRRQHHRQSRYQSSEQGRDRVDDRRGNEGWQTDRKNDRYRSNYY